MQNLYGIKGLRIKTFVVEQDEDVELNTFFEEYDGNIINIQTVNLMMGLMKYIIVYKATED